MTIHLTQPRIAAALAAATQPEGERPWTLLLTKAPTTYRAVRSAFVLEQNEDLRRFSGKDEATAKAEASRARIIQELARRDGYLSALSAAEHMLSTTPVLPVGVDTRLAPWDDGPSLTFRFHKAPDDVRAFAAHFGTEVAELPHGENSVRIETTGVTETGVRFEAYALVDAPAVAQ